jgi:hypothetical protein
MVTFITLINSYTALAILPFLCSLHDVHKMNVYRTDHACLSVHASVCIIKLENHWTDLDEI